MSKTIILVGGGSGGHLTPLLSVAEAIKRRDRTVRIIFIGQKGENLHEVMAKDVIDETVLISAGKFRRYHGESFLQHILDVKTILLNFRDFFRFLHGLWDSWKILRKYKPTVIFLKGGFVSVPVGYVARFQHIPYVTHDSDAIPGLANRLTAAHARFNLTALPAALYPYDAAKSRQVGIPIQSAYRQLSESDVLDAKKQLGFSEEDTVILSVGGGLGAQKINHALARSAANLLKDSRSVIIHVTGKKLFEETKALYTQELNESQLRRVKLIDFTTELYRYSAAADVVITRAGATNIAEFGVQQKLCIVVPNPVLTGGQQLHNAKILSDAGAAVVVDEDSLDQLYTVIKETLSLPLAKRQQYASALGTLSTQDAADKISDILLAIE